MKIVKLEDFYFDAGWDTYALLKITTDEGFVGWSEFSERRGRRGLAGLILSFGGLVSGKDPRALNEIDALLQSATRSTAGGLTAHAIGAIMNACIEIKAKALGVPVYELFGGALRKRLPVYWSRCGVTRALQASYFGGNPVEAPAVRSLDDLVAAAREARERGFKALKTNLLLFDGKGGARRAYVAGSSRGVSHPDLNFYGDVETALVDQLTALREGAGPGVRLIVDLNFDYKTEGFRRLARKLEPFDLMWLEMDHFDASALAMIRQSTTTPIGSLEAILGRRNLKPFLAQNTVDVAIIDVQYNGIVESIRMATMADAYEVNVASHGFAGPLTTVISAHFCAAIPNFRIMECDIDEVPWRSHLLTNPYRIENGEIVLPEGPGWGTEIDESVLKAHAAKM
ncbi:MAG TPA: mandelate racemase/muconate lactonizing enzyme family protein [Beijerinckiaceae bacterium]|jgi:L-alanine-DL-glutamate epimerase-like enolase superfamily enzyme|nr:mandelate racemase/muconate lactonizing enzyme family protein [Beijerinckiaceae bacterium]